ncbi:hypothetical protein EN942_29805, partial [Mesorhizobium sp. M7A.F.Ca.CA.001.14.1.1]
MITSKRRSCRSGSSVRSSPDTSRSPIPIQDRQPHRSRPLPKGGQETPLTVVAGLKYTQGWGSITGVAAYDSNYEAFAGKIRVDVAVTNQLSLFGLFGYGSNASLNEDSNGAIANHGRGSYKIWNGQWAFWAGATYE